MLYRSSNCRLLAAKPFQLLLLESRMTDIVISAASVDSFWHFDSIHLCVNVVAIFADKLVKCSCCQHDKWCSRCNDDDAI